MSVVGCINLHTRDNGPGGHGRVSLPLLGLGDESPQRRLGRHDRFVRGRYPVSIDGMGIGGIRGCRLRRRGRDAYYLGASARSFVYYRGDDDGGGGGTADIILLRWFVREMTDLLR